MSSGRRAGGLLLCAMLLGPAAAGAEDAPQAAQEYKRHMADAKQLFHIKQYAQAIHEYEAAYDLKQNPILLFNIAGCHRHAENLEAALATYERFIVVAPEGPLKVEARGFVAELRTKLDLKRLPPVMPQPFISPVTPPPDPVAMALASMGKQVSVKLATPRANYRFHVRLLHTKFESVHASLQSVECDPPCKVELYPGLTSVNVSGAATFFQNVNVPTRPATLEIIAGTPGKRKGGIVLLSVGGSLIAVGLLSLLTSWAFSSGSNSSSAHNGYIVGDVFIGIGAVGMIAGGVLLGTSRKNNIQVNEDDRTEATRPYRLSFGAQPLPGGGASVLNLAF